MIYRPTQVCWMVQRLPAMTSSLRVIALPAALLRTKTLGNAEYVKLEDQTITDQKDNCGNPLTSPNGIMCGTLDSIMGPYLNQRLLLSAPKSKDLVRGRCHLSAVI